MSATALAAIFGTSFLVSLTGALSPGPLTTLAVREGVQRGFRAGPALALGHGAIELALVIGLAFGLNRLLDQNAVAVAISLLGGLFLLWLGSRIIRTTLRQELVIAPAGAADGPSATVTLGAQPEPVSLAGLGALALAGVAVSVTNPFWVLWWATVGAAYIVQALDYGAAGVASFYGAHFLTDLGWLSLVAFILANGRRIMNRWAYRGLLLACGLFLLGLAGWFLASGLGYIL